MAKGINWLEVRAGYEAGIPVRALAAEFGIGSPGTIGKRADREGWAKPLRPGDVTGTGDTPSVTTRKRRQERKPGVSSAVSETPEPPAPDGGKRGADGLTERERRFVLQYVCTGQPQLAARRAGYQAVFLSDNAPHADKVETHTMVGHMAAQFTKAHFGPGYSWGGLLLPGAIPF